MFGVLGFLPGCRCHEFVRNVCTSHPAVLWSQMCPHLLCNVSEIESEMSEDDEAQFNIWNNMLESFTLQGSSPTLQYD